VGGMRANMPRYSHSKYTRYRSDDEALRDIAEKRDNIFFIDPVEHLCSDEQCMTVLNGRVLYSDKHHLSKFGSSLLIEKIFTELLLYTKQ